MTIFNSYVKLSEANELRSARYIGSTAWNADWSEHDCWQVPSLRAQDFVLGHVEGQEISAPKKTPRHGGELFVSVKDDLFNQVEWWFLKHHYHWVNHPPIHNWVNHHSPFTIIHGWIKNQWFYEAAQWFHDSRWSDDFQEMTSCKICTPVLRCRADIYIYIYTGV